MQTLQAQESNLAASQTASQQKQADARRRSNNRSRRSSNRSRRRYNPKASCSPKRTRKNPTYEKLLAAAEAELKSFSAFAQNAGGSKLLGNQTVCDAWGCYYNQRDTAWGNDSLDGTKYHPCERRLPRHVHGDGHDALRLPRRDARDHQFESGQFRRILSGISARRPSTSTA